MVSGGRHIAVSWEDAMITDTLETGAKCMDDDVRAK